MDETEDESYAAFLAERREEILQRIAEAAARAGRDASEVELLAVSKTVDVPQVDLAWKVGIPRLWREPPPGARSQAQGNCLVPPDGQCAL
jgi:hypothetical protein